MTENPIVANFECPRCGPWVVRQCDDSFMQTSRGTMYGEEEEDLTTRPTAWLQQDADSEYKKSYVHLKICAEITRRVEGGEILLSIEYLRASRKRMTEQFAWRERVKYPNGNPNLDNRNFEYGERWWAKREKEKCRGCHFLPLQCGCALAITAYEPRLDSCDYDGVAKGIEERMKSLACLSCFKFFADCKCDKASLHPKPQPPLAEQVRWDMARDRASRGETNDDFNSRTDDFIGNNIGLLTFLMMLFFFVGFGGLLLSSIFGG